MSVTGTLIYGAGKPRRVGLGTIGFHTTGFRNLRFVLPAGLRSELPLGSSVWVSLAVTAKADNANGCPAPAAVTSKLKLKVVKVLSTGQAGIG